MPIATGFGLFDAPFASGGGLPRFTIPGFGSAGSSGGTGASGGGGVSSAPATVSPAASGPSLFDSVIGTIGNAIGRAADFGAQLFVYDELAERGQAPASVAGAGQTPAAGASGAATGTKSSSFIKGVPNETLFIGLAVVVVLLLLFTKGRGK